MAEEHDPFDERCATFYCRAMSILHEAKVPFLVGGAFALHQYAGIYRDTRDFDVFLRPSDLERALNAFESAGFETERTAPHWLAKILYDDLYVDLIYSSGNGVATVDDEWFAHGVEADVLGMKATLVPSEEMIWSKGFIMERERFDGADVLHILRVEGPKLDWDRLLRRYGEHWRVLLAHLVLFGFAYPTERDRIPARVVRELTKRLDRELGSADEGDALAQGTLLSRTQYLPDVRRWGYGDARLLPPGEVPAEELEPWDEAGLRQQGPEVPR